jgi:TolB-like protein
VNLSPDPDQEYFVDGLSEELLNCLSKIADLRVTSRTSSFTFKGSDRTIQEIAGVLGVDYILEGSVRKAGNALRISAQLIRVEDDYHLWSETYKRELKDIFEVQEDIATSVADELKVTLGIGQSFKQLGGTDNLEAYELYLVALGLMGEDISTSMNRVLNSLDAAIALDPEYASAWAVKAIGHWARLVLMPPNRVVSEKDSVLNAALRVIELEPNLADGYYSLGLSRFVKGDYIEAELAYRKGMKLSSAPMKTSDFGMFHPAVHSLAVGYFERACEFEKANLQIYPLNQGTRGLYIFTLGLLSDTQRAEEEYDRGRALFGDHWFWGDLFLTILRLGTKDVVSRDEIVHSNLIFDAAKEHLDSPEEGLAELRLLYSDDSNLSENDITNISLWAAYFGDPEFAMNAMEKGIRINASGLFKIWLPVMHEVRQLPRFKKFVIEMGLIDFWNRFGCPDLCRPVGDDDFECD